MSFQNLNKDELKEVTDFFVVDVEAADAEHGPTKKEYIAALAAGDEPVTWEQYKEIYVPAKESGQDKSREVILAEEAAKAAEEAAKAEADKAPAVQEQAQAERDNPREEVPAEDEVLVKYERKNPSYQTRGYLFTQAHPYSSVPASVAEYLIRKEKGFRLALPSEVTDYYN